MYQLLFNSKDSLATIHSANSCTMSVHTAAVVDATQSKTRLFCSSQSDLGVRLMSALSAFHFSFGTVAAKAAHHRAAMASRVGMKLSRPIYYKIQSQTSDANTH